MTTSKLRAGDAMSARKYVMGTRPARTGFARLELEPRLVRVSVVGETGTMPVARTRHAGSSEEDIMSEERRRWIEELRNTPDRLEALARRCPADTAARRPSPDAFSAREVIHHLRDIEIEGHGARLARMLTEPEPRLADVDGGRLAIERSYNDRPHETALTEFREARARSIARLESLSGEEWARRGTLEGVGSISIERLVEIWRIHDHEHLEEMLRLVGADGRTRRRRAGR
jgi:hypothetical protein